MSKTTKQQTGRRSRRPSPAPASETVRIKLTFRCLEYHTIVRDVPKAEFEMQRRERDVMAWLDEEYRDCDMGDSDINTESFELDKWKMVKSSNTKLSRG